MTFGIKEELLRMMFIMHNMSWGYINCSKEDRMGQVVDLTEAMEKRAKNPSPCDGCEMGHFSEWQWTDLETGHLMEERTDCHDDCKEYIEWSNALLKEKYYKRFPCPAPDLLEEDYDGDINR